MSLLDLDDEESGDGGRARAEYDYVAAEDNELPLREGEILTDIKKLDPGWWLVKNAEGKTGLVPSNYLTELANVPPAVPVQSPQPYSQARYEHPKIENLSGGPYIRLLEILPGDQMSGLFPSMFSPSTRVHRRLRCRLMHLPLRDHMPEYDALSYYWGPPEDKVTVDCSDEFQCGFLEITRNLYAALLALSNRMSGKSRYIWADGICMNQTKEEKNLQVPLMTEIYHRAARVVVWLGEELSETLPAVQAISKCANALLTKPTASASTMPMLEWMMLGFQSREEAKYQLRAFFKFLARPWFGRVWVIQEFAMARSLLFLCGQYEIQEAQLMNASAWAASSGADALVAPWGSNTLVMLHAIRSEQQCRVKRPLLNLLASFRHRHATIPKDKIYAIYSLAADGGLGAGGLNIQVDYDKTTKEEAFKSLAISFLLRDAGLDIVTLAGIYDPFEPPLSMLPPGTKPYERCEGLPSWVPDWCSPECTTSVMQFEAMRPHHCPNATGLPHYTFPAESPPTVFKASGNSTYTLSFADDGDDGLIVHGIILDTIKTLGRFHTDATAVPDQTRWHLEVSEHEEMFKICQHMELLGQWIDITGAETNRTYFTGESMIDVFWQTMGLGHFPHGFPRERQQFFEWYSFGRPFMKICRQFQWNYSSRHQMVAAYNNYLATATASGAAVSPKTNFSARTNHVTGNRGMFVTERLGLVGMGVRGSRQGDSVVILQGGKVPFIVRRRGGAWVVVGACYVHGCMKGELWDERRRREMILL